MPTLWAGQERPFPGRRTVIAVRARHARFVRPTGLGQERLGRPHLPQRDLDLEQFVGCEEIPLQSEGTAAEDPGLRIRPPLGEAGVTGRLLPERVGLLELLVQRLVARVPGEDQRPERMPEASSPRVADQRRRPQPPSAAFAPFFCSGLWSTPASRRWAAVIGAGASVSGS